MRIIAHTALWATTILVAAGCSGTVDGARSGNPRDGSAQPLTAGYFYGNAVGMGAVYAVPVGGGSPSPIVTGDSTHDVGNVVTFDAKRVYYSSQDSASSAEGQSFSFSLSSVLIAGDSSPITLASRLDLISGIAVDATNVYFSVQTANTFDDAGIPTPHGEIHSVPIGGGAERVLATLAATLGGIAVDSEYVYSTALLPSGSGMGSVLKTPIGGGTTVTIAAGQLSPRAIAVDATGVYWIDYGTMGTDCTSRDGSLWELPAGSSIPKSLASSLHGPASLALSGADVYWSEDGAYCNVEPMPLGSVSKRAGATGVKSTVASALFGPGNLYVGGSLLYFTQVVDASNDVLAPSVSKL